MIASSPLFRPVPPDTLACEALKLWFDRLESVVVNARHAVIAAKVEKRVARDRAWHCFDAIVGLKCEAMRKDLGAARQEGERRLIRGVYAVGFHDEQSRRIGFNSIIVSDYSACLFAGRRCSTRALPD